MMMQSIDIGQKKIGFLGRIVDYSGEILDGDKATGLGEFTNIAGSKYSGQFVNGMLEGACTSSNQINPLQLVNIGMMIKSDKNRWEGEWKENEYHGKSTIHYTDGSMMNSVRDNGKYKSEKEITDKDECFYLSGIPQKALAPDWSEFV